MRTALQILMAQGYTEAEAKEVITAQPKLAAALEKEEARVVAQQEKYNTELADYQTKLKNTEEWYNKTALPAINKATTEAVNARAERARLQAQLEAEQEMGLRRVASTDEQEQIRQREEQRLQRERQQNTNANDPDPRYVSAEVFRQTTDSVGLAIAMAQDIVADYQDLFGKRMPGGFSKLRDDYMAARQSGFTGNMAAFADKQYGFSTKREELAKLARDKELADARADERAKIMSEMMNPQTRQFQTSRNPFIKGRITEGTTDGKQPWDRGSREQRHSARVMEFGPRVLNDVNGGRRSA